MKKIINKFKRGFTIVELVIVIAVIAILAAVLIPTLSNVLNSAEESADMQTVYHLNQILSSYSTVGDGAETISEAIEQADENGYNVSKLTPTSDGDILWDSASNRFLLVSSSGEVLYSDSATKIDEITSGTIYPNLWKIVSSSSEVTSQYSICYSANYSETLTTLAISNVGVDVSAYTANTVNISYTGDNSSTDADNIVIIGNGGTLTLNDTNVIDDIKFYGIASTVTATSVASASLHIHGTVTGNIDMHKGRVVIESGSNAKTVVSKGSGVEVVNSSSNEIEVGYTNASYEPTVSGSNVNSSSVDETSLSYFAGGLGTENSPYQIATAEQFVNIGKFSTAMGNKSYIYFTLTDDIDLRDVDLSGSQYVSSYFCGQLDGNNYTLISNDDLSWIFANAVGGSSVDAIILKDLTYLLNDNNVGLCKGVRYSYTSVTFDNVDIGMVDTTNSITLLGNNGVYLDWAGYSSQHGWIKYSTYNLIDCDCSVNISNATSYNAVFIGGGIYYSTVTVDNCSYSGKYIGQQCGLVLGNATTAYMTQTRCLTINSFTNTGTVLGTSYTPVLAGASSEKGIVSDYYYVNGENISLGGTIKYLSDSGLAVSVDSNGQYVITKGTDASSYSLTIQAGIRHLLRSDGGGSENSSYYFTVDLGNITFTNGLYETGFYTGKFATKDQYLELVDSTETFSSVTWYDVTSEDGAKVCMIKYQETDGSYTYYYVFDFSETLNASIFTDIYFATKSGTVYTSACVATKQGSVSSYDSTGEIKGTAYTN